MSFNKIAQNNPIFIYGCIRSGTTLLRSILNSHPQICCPRETAFFLLANQKNNLNEDASAFWDNYKKHRRFEYQNISIESVENQLESKRFNYRQLFTALMSAILNDSNKSIWCEKTPGHELFLKPIFQSFPTAKNIFVIRDVRAVVLSMSKTPWGSKNLYVQCKIWKKSIKQYQRYASTIPMMKVRYEDLVNNTENEVFSICKLIGIEYTPKMLTQRSIIGTNVDDPRSEWRQNYENAVSRDVDSLSLET